MEHLVQGPIHLYVILSQLSTLRYGQMHLYVIQSELSTSRYGLSAPLPGFGRACPHGSNLVRLWYLEGCTLIDYHEISVHI